MHPERVGVVTGAEQLRLLLDDLDRLGTPPPCRDRPEWLSEDYEDRLAARYRCRPCPALEVCGRAAAERKEAWGVWGGTDRGHRPQKKEKTA